MSTGVSISPVYLRCYVTNSCGYSVPIEAEGPDGFDSAARRLAHHCRTGHSPDDYDWTIYDHITSARFFWRSGRKVDRWPLLRLGADENCNRVLTVRIPGGALNVCLNLPLRQKACVKCLREEHAWVWKNPARRLPSA